MRLVPEQTVGRAARCSKAYQKDRAEDRPDHRPSYLHGGDPAITPIDSPGVRTAVCRPEKGFGKKPLYQREGGSIPIVVQFKNLLGIDTVLLGFGHQDENAHAPDEFMSLVISSAASEHPCTSTRTFPGSCRKHGGSPSPLHNLLESTMTLVDRASTMSLVDRAKNIIITPKTEWQVVAAETPNIQQIILGYVVPLALIPAVATILGGLLFRSGIFFSVSYYIATALVTFVAAVLGVFVTAFVIDFLAPNFGSQKGLGRAVQLVAYSYTPAWVAGILNIIPGLGVIAALVGLYGIYLMYLGLPPLMKTPDDKVVVYLVVTVIVLLVVYFVLAAILGAIFFGILGIGAITTGGMHY